MDTGASRPGRSIPPPDGARRLSAAMAQQHALNENAPAGRSARRHLSDVLADLMQRDPKD